MLTSAQITRMREIADMALPDTCTISRATTASDSKGGQTQTWANVATDVDCRLSSPRTQPTHTVAGETPQTVATWTITLAANTDIRPSDRIFIGTRVFEVDAAGDRSYEISLRVTAREIL